MTKQAKTFNDLLQIKYGERGTPKREEFEVKVEAFYLHEMMKETMNSPQSYPFIGSKEIAQRVASKYEGTKIREIDDILQWMEAENQTIMDEQITATFIINEQQELVISDRHSEHVVCAGGRKVLSVGEITFAFGFEGEEIYVSEISNQSTGYCPKPSSWEAVEIALKKIGVRHPAFFTKAYKFRFCENCQTINLIKEETYECAVCEGELELEWNMDKTKK